MEEIHLPQVLPPNCGPSLDLIAKLDKALIAARSNYGSLARDADNPYFKSRYLTLDKLLAAVTPALGEQGLSLSSSYSVTAAGGFMVTTTLSHIGGGFRYSCLPVLDASKSQAMGSAGTYALRYNLSQLLAIAAEDDDDGNSADGLKIKGSEKPERAMAISSNGLL